MSVQTCPKFCFFFLLGEMGRNDNVADNSNHRRKRNEATAKDDGSKCAMERPKPTRQQLRM